MKSAFCSGRRTYPGPLCMLESCCLCQPCFTFFTAFAALTPSAAPLPCPHGGRSSDERNVSDWLVVNGSNCLSTEVGRATGQISSDWPD